MSVYTKEFTKDLVERYTSVKDYEAQQEVLREIAEVTGVKIASLRAKLAREGVYQAKVRSSGVKAQRKSELVAQLASLVEQPEEKVESFEKATRKALEIVVGRLRAVKES